MVHFMNWKSVNRRQPTFLFLLLLTLSLLIPGTQVEAAEPEASVKTKQIKLPARFEEMDVSKQQAVSSQVAPMTDLHLENRAISPDWDNYADFTHISYLINVYLPYFSLDVFAIDGDTLTYQGTVSRYNTNVAAGEHGIRFWGGEVWLGSNQIQLWDGHYAMVPRVGLEDGDLLMDQLVDFVIDFTSPVSVLGNPSITVEDGIGTIHGRVISDLMVDVLGDYSGITVFANPSNDSKVQYDGVFDDDGNFSIEVPLNYGKNYFYITIHDAAYNGARESSHEVRYERIKEDTTPEIAVVASKTDVTIGEAFDVSVNFARVTDLYAAQFSLTYDSKLLKGSIEPSVVLGNYQRQEYATTSIITSEKTVDLGNGRVRTDYVVSLAGDIAGYSGNGSFMTIHFSSMVPGEFGFVLSNVQAVNSNAQAIKFETVKNTSISVVSGPGELQHKISGHITAEAFGSDINYSTVWYDGAEGVHKVVVEAVDSKGYVAAIGEVKADGSYTLRVPNGTFKVRIVVPGHVTAIQSIEVNRDITLNVGPLNAGDVDGNGKIGLIDLQFVAKQFGKSKIIGWWDFKASGADLNRDNEVDLLDISYIIANYSLT